jgi:hypothetical protein
MNRIILFQGRWSGVGNLVGGILGALVGLLLVFSGKPFGFVFMLAGIGASVYGGMLLNAVNDEESDST